MDKINETYNIYNEFFQYTNNFLTNAYNISEQDKKEIDKLTSENKLLQDENTMLENKITSIKLKYNKKEIDKLTSENKLLQDELNNIKFKEHESTNLILKLDETIASLREKNRNNEERIKELEKLLKKV